MPRRLRRSVVRDPVVSISVASDASLATRLGEQRRDEALSEKRVCGDDPVSASRVSGILPPSALIRPACCGYAEAANTMSSDVNSQIEMEGRVAWIRTWLFRCCGVSEGSNDYEAKIDKPHAGLRELRGFRGKVGASAAVYWMT